jgi:amino acid adenylation domain-containing protein
MPGNKTFNVPSIVRLSGQLDAAALEHSFTELTRRHESLRTTFDMVDGELMQIIHQPAATGMQVIDLQALSQSEQEAQIRELAEAELTRPFDLVHGPLMRTTLVKQSEQEHVLLIMKHHIVTDGWSMGIFFYELTTLYACYAQGAPSPLPELTVQYADYAHWQREWLQGEDLEKQLSYWREQLGGELPVLQLPTDFPRPAVQTYQGKELLFSLPKSLADGLTTWGKGEGVTLFMTLLGSFQTLLHRYTGQEDILVGSPIAGRNDADIESIIGSFVNTLVMRTDLSGDPTFRELIARVSDVALGAYGHQELPFEKLVEELQPERNTAHSPVFQVMFVLQNTPSEFTMELPGLTMSTVEANSGSAQFDLMLTLTEREHELFGKWQFNTDLFEESTAWRMISHFQTLLEDILAHPDKKLSQLDILPAAERQKLLVEFNDDRTEVATDICIHQLFAEQVVRTPDAEAIVWGEERLTYRELNTRAERLASYLRHHGVGPEVLVGINVERSLEMVIGMLGILKAGGAYVPLDPAYPADRLGFILEDAKAAVLLTEEHLLGRLPKQAADVICLDRDWSLIEAGADSDLANVAVAEPHNLAYVIYTSGSTGRPKGVAIEHRNAAALIAWAKGVYAPEQLAGVLASTSICFDLSVFELFVTLSVGGKVILAENALHLPTLPARHDVTLINTVPSAITELLRLEGIPSSVHTINLAGEPLRRALVERIYELGTVEAVYNLYGPSEDTTYSTFTKVERGEEVTIGRPITNSQAYLLDANGQPVPLGVPGELHLGGDGLARGYLNREDQTAEKFITNPVCDEANARLYKTGDLARYLANGTLEYLGRIDHQVKIRGFRIELGEIEAVLGQHPAIRETVLLAREEETGEKRLVAYVVPAQEQAPTVVELRGYLSEKLPEYMIPSVFTILDEMPLTPNGKVDRKRLPAPNEARGNQGSTYVAPRDLVEMEMVKLWEEVLQVKPIGVHDNFFALGGHSLKALSLVGEVRKRFDVELPIVTLFQALTVADLCQRVRGEVETPATGCLVPLQQGDGTRAPLFLVHPQSGGVFCYFGLSRALGAEETVYGLQAPGFEGEAALLTSFDEMADRYLEEIRRVAPQGPYRLAGWSLGGTIVYEMARRLEAQGEAVEFLGLIDVHTFGEGNIVRNIEPIEHDWTEASALHHLARSMNMDTAIFDELDADQGLKALLEYAQEHGVLPYGISTETTWTQMRVQITNQVALDSYRWAGPIASDVHLFCATELDALHHALVDPQDWVSRTTGTLHVESISGDHHTIVEPPHVLKLAERMKQALEKVCK